MPPDRLQLEDANRWLAIARSDLHAAGILAAAGSYSEALFHCQQAAEKALKGFLTRHGRPFRKTHDISDISADCLEIDRSLDAVLTNAEPLTQYAWRFRYPGAPFEPGAADAAEAFDTARAVLESIESLLKDRC